LVVNVNTKEGGREVERREEPQGEEEKTIEEKDSFYDTLCYVMRGDMMIKLPRDRITLNGWIRNYYQLNPIVRNVITAHSLMSIDNFSIGFFSNIKAQNDCISELFNLGIASFEENIGSKAKFTPGQKLYDISREYWLIGEVFPVIENHVSILNPDAVFVKNSKGREIQLRPDPYLRKMVFSNLKADVEETKKLSKGLVESIKNDNTVPIDGVASQIMRVNSPYDVRGTSLIYPILKALVNYDEFLENDPGNIEGIKFYEDKIFEGLLFKSDKIDLIFLEYSRFKHQLSKWIKKIIIEKGLQADVDVYWKEINTDKLKAVLGGSNGR